MRNYEFWYFVTSRVKKSSARCRSYNCKLWKAEALAEVKSVAQARGFSLDELLGAASTKSKRGPVPAKYADPANPNNTWSGRGRKPKWLVAQLDQGKSVEDFAL